MRRWRPSGRYEPPVDRQTRQSHRPRPARAWAHFTPPPVCCAGHPALPLQGQPAFQAMASISDSGGAAAVWLWFTPRPPRVATVTCGQLVTAAGNDMAEGVQVLLALFWTLLDEVRRASADNKSVTVSTQPQHAVNASEVEESPRVQAARQTHMVEASGGGSSGSASPAGSSHPLLTLLLLAGVGAAVVAAAVGLRSAVRRMRRGDRYVPQYRPGTRAQRGSCF